MIQGRRWVWISLLSTFPAMAADEPSPKAVLNPLHAIGESDLKAFVDTPLFDPTRRAPPVFAPVTAPTPAANFQADLPPNLRLLGVVHGAKDVAVIRGADGKTVMASNGDQIADWTISVLPANVIRLTKGGRSHDYAIFSTNGAADGVVSTPTPSVDGEIDRP